MNSAKTSLKYFFIKTNTLFILDRINFAKAWIQNFSKNRNFKNADRRFRIPPDYFLYESYKLNYRQYKEEGKLSANEIIDWTKNYLPENKNILEWGCGVARVVRHIPPLVSQGTKLYGADINGGMIRWDRENIENIFFDTINYQPPTQYADNYFHLVFALSVFTHIEKQLQLDWIKEISRILVKDGIFLFTTHGNKYFDQLNAADKKKLTDDGAYTISYKSKGHRMMSTYNRHEHFKIFIENKFNMLEYYDGQKFPDKVGGQDLWIVQKI